MKVFNVEIDQNFILVFVFTLNCEFGQKLAFDENSLESLTDSKLTKFHGTMMRFERKRIQHHAISSSN